jgi:hypothetical protein
MPKTQPLSLSATKTMTSSTARAHPLFGFIPRKVTSKEVQNVIVRPLFLPFSVLSLFSRKAMKILSRVYHTALSITRFLTLEKSCRYSRRWMSFTKWSVSPFLPIPFILEHGVVDTTAKYNDHQVIVMVGETGSGKTTQCVLTHRLSFFYQCLD